MRPGGGQVVDDRPLRRPVERRDLGGVGLPLHRDGPLGERPERDGVGGVGQLQRQGQLLVDVDAVVHRGQCSAINSSVRIRSGRPWVIVDTMISLAPVR